MKQVTCNGLPFTIVNGRRVWLTVPPSDIRRDIEYDRRRAQSWQKLRQEDCKE